MSSTTRRRILDGPLTAALVALLALAVATVWVVVRGGDDPQAAGEAGTGNVIDSGDLPTSDQGDEPDDGSTLEATDGTFTSVMPAGYADAGDMGLLPLNVLAIYDASRPDAEMPTVIIVMSAAASGASLEDSVADVKSGFEDTYDTTTEDSAIGITEVDGSKAIGWQSGDYTDGGTKINSTQYWVEHGDTFYFFTVNAMVEYTDESRDALSELLTNVKWNDLT